jgi:uncharacterized protein (DUF362 family)
MSSGYRPTRRDVLKAVPVAAVAVGACGRRPYTREDFPLPARSSVALLSAGYDEDLAETIGRGLRELAIDVRDRSVLLKPNLVEYVGSGAVNTHPAVVAGAIGALRRAGARSIIVGEGPGHRRDVEYLLAATGLGDRLRDLNVRFVDLNHDDVRRVPLRSRFTGLDALWLPSQLLAADLVVTLPKLKTHHWAAMTASLKNLFGVVPGAVYGWPKNLLHVRGITQSILDLAATVRPRLSIVDAIVAMEGDGPIMGRPVAAGFLAIGADPVAVDATCARAIGLDPSKIAYLSEASAFLGHVDASRIDQRGEPLHRFTRRFDVIDAHRALRLPG